MEVGQVDDALVHGLGRVNHLHELRQPPLLLRDAGVLVKVGGGGIADGVQAAGEEQDQKTTDLGNTN